MLTQETRAAGPGPCQLCWFKPVRGGLAALDCSFNRPFEQGARTIVAPGFDACTRRTCLRRVAVALLSLCTGYGMRCIEVSKVAELYSAVWERAVLARCVQAAPAVGQLADALYVSLCYMLTARPRAKAARAPIPSTVWHLSTASVSLSA